MATAAGIKQATKYIDDTIKNFVQSGDNFIGDIVANSKTSSQAIKAIREKVSTAKKNVNAGRKLMDEIRDARYSGEGSYGYVQKLDGDSYSEFVQQQVNKHIGSNFVQDQKIFETYEPIAKALKKNQNYNILDTFKKYGKEMAQDAPDKSINDAAKDAINKTVAKEFGESTTSPIKPDVPANKAADSGVPDTGTQNTNTAPQNTDTATNKYVKGMVDDEARAELAKNKFKSLDDMATHRKQDAAYGVYKKYNKENLTVQEIAARDKEIGDILGRDINLMDKAAYYKVPQKVGGAAGIAFLVQKMSNTRGQMSNSQLYGQE